jgi:hypothetical protein
MSYTETDAQPTVTQPEALVVARDGTTLHVRSGQIRSSAPPRWYLEVISPDPGMSFRAEWKRDADFRADNGVEVDLMVGGRTAKAVLRDGEMSLVHDDADVRAGLGAMGERLLRFKPGDWPFHPSLSDLMPAVETAGEFADCVATVAVVSAGVGALAGGIAGSFAAGVGFVDGATVGGISGLAIGAAGGAIGCGIGWAVEG